MSRNRRRLNGFSAPPSKGTMARDALELMYAGATKDEILVSTGMAAGGFPGMLDRLRDQCGFDIMTIDVGLPAAESSYRGGRHPLIYRVVGRMHWDGSYETYVDPDEEYPGVSAAP